MNNKKRRISRCTIIAITLIIIFSVMLSGSFFAIKDDAVLQQKLHDNTIAGIDSFQSGYNGTQNYKEYEESLYENGIEAFINGYQNYLNTPSCEVAVTGVIEVTVPAVNMRFNLDVTCSVSKKGNMVTNTLILYNKDQRDYSSMTTFKNINGQITEEKAIRIYKENGKIKYDKKDLTVKRFTKEEYRDVNGVLPGELYYIVNASTIASANNFYAKRDSSGKILCYNSEFSLNSNLATTNYSKTITRTMEAVRPAAFTSTYGSFSLDNLGRIVSVKGHDKFNFAINKGIVVDVNCTAHLEYTITY